MLSIIIPYYNTGCLLLETIESVEKLTLDLKDIFGSVEVIIVDDGSKTYPIDNLVFPKVSFTLKIQRTSNSGVSTARNLGFDLCTGDYVLYLDSDDLFLSDAIKYLKQKKNNFADITIFKYKKFSELDELNDIFQNEELCSKNFTNNYILGNLKGLVHLGSCIFKKRFIESNKVSFDSEYKYGEDQSYLIDLLLSNPNLDVTNVSLLGYRYNQNSAMNQFTESRFDVVDMLIEKYNNSICKIKDLQVDFWNRIITELDYNCRLYILNNANCNVIEFIKVQVKPRINNIEMSTIKKYKIYSGLIIYKLYRYVKKNSNIFN